MDLLGTERRAFRWLLVTSGVCVMTIVVAVVSTRWYTWLIAFSAFCNAFVALESWRAKRRTP